MLPNSINNYITLSKTLSIIRSSNAPPAHFFGLLGIQNFDSEQLIRGKKPRIRIISSFSFVTSKIIQLFKPFLYENMRHVRFLWLNLWLKKSEYAQLLFLCVCGFNSIFMLISNYFHFVKLILITKEEFGNNLVSFDFFERGFGGSDFYCDYVGQVYFKFASGFINFDLHFWQSKPFTYRNSRTAPITKLCDNFLRDFISVPSIWVDNLKSIERRIPSSLKYSNYSPALHRERETSFFVCFDMIYVKLPLSIRQLYFMF